MMEGSLIEGENAVHSKKYPMGSFPTCLFLSPPL